MTSKSKTLIILTSIVTLGAAIIGSISDGLNIFDRLGGKDSLSRTTGKDKFIPKQIRDNNDSDETKFFIDSEETKPAFEQGLNTNIIDKDTLHFYYRNVELHFSRKSNSIFRFSGKLANSKMTLRVAGLGELLNNKFTIVSCDIGGFGIDSLKGVLDLSPDYSKLYGKVYFKVCVDDILHLRFKWVDASMLINYSSVKPPETNPYDYGS